MNERGQFHIEYIRILALLLMGVIIVAAVIVLAAMPINRSQSAFNDDILAVTEGCMKSNTSATAAFNSAIKSVNADGFLSCLYARDVTLSVRGDPVVVGTEE